MVRIKDIKKGLCSTSASQCLGGAVMLRYKEQQLHSLFHTGAGEFIPVLPSQCPGSLEIPPCAGARGSQWARELG